jgi:hypothetical protein
MPLADWARRFVRWMTTPAGQKETTSEVQVRRAVAADEQKAAEHAQEDQLRNDPNKVVLRWLAKLGAGVVSGLGLAGLVSLVGAAVLFERFKQAGLPATQALNVVPDSQLTIEGASLLIASLLVGAVAVMLLFSLDHGGQVTRGSLVALALLYIGGMIWAIGGADLRVHVLLGLAALGLLLIAGSIGIAKVTGSSFVPFALAIFASTIVWSGALQFAIAADQNFAQPAAVLRSSEGAGIRGLYVGDNDDAIYIGVIRAGFEPNNPDDAPPLYRIPREDITRLLVGKPRKFEEAVSASESLRQQLKANEKLADPLPAADNSAPAEPDSG